MNYFKVVIDSNSRYLDTPFTYKSEKDVEVGNLVKVGFGNGNKEYTGYVVELENSLPKDISEEKIKEITEINEEFTLTKEIIDTAMWMRFRYAIKYIDAIRPFLPGGKKPKRKIKEKAFTGIYTEDTSGQILTAEQNLVSSRLIKAMELEEPRGFLLHGVTGSGKTRVYIEIVKKAMEESKQSIVLVPEIALTKQLVERFSGYFGVENIAILHSKLKPSERFLQWEKVRSGKAKVVIGARMAIFAPVTNLGVIIMDEEHEATYKSDMTPKYETIDIAYKRMVNLKSILVLGSATPSISSYQRAESGIYELLEMKERYNGVELPHVTIVDMKDELKKGNTGIFSSLLKDSIRDSLEKKEQVILFLNRRGYSNFITCTNCGEVLECPDCKISLTYHKNKNAGVCHYCNRHFPIPQQCPSCKKNTLKYIGMGTEQIEEIIRDVFPQARVHRLDLDTGKTTENVNEIIEAFSKKEIDILVGTQLIAKGLDFDNVGLVGVLAADGSLNIPDYRASERTFQLITQVAGRAGRGVSGKGKVVVQTYNPDNFAIVNACNYDYKNFYNDEIMSRKLMNYPPYSDFISVEFISDNQLISRNQSEGCYSFLIDKKEPWSNQVFPPKESTFLVGEGKYKYYILIKCPKGHRGTCLGNLMQYRNRILQEKKTSNMVIDVNPYSIM